MKSPLRGGRCCWSASVGALPFDAGLTVEPGHLADVPIFVAQGDNDHVIPRELLDRTWIADRLAVPSNDLG